MSNAQPIAAGLFGQQTGLATLHALSTQIARLDGQAAARGFTRLMAGKGGAMPIAA